MFQVGSSKYINLLKQVRGKKGAALGTEFGSCGHFLYFLIMIFLEIGERVQILLAFVSPRNGWTHSVYRYSSKEKTMEIIQ